MANFVTLTCPTCGGRLEIAKNIERFACGFCGNELIVQRAGGIVSIMPVVEELKQVKSGVDRTASELALKRLRREIKEVEIKIKQLCGELIKYNRSSILSVLYETVRKGQRRPRFIQHDDDIAIAALEKTAIREIETMIDVYEDSLKIVSTGWRATLVPIVKTKTRHSLATLKSLLAHRKAIEEKEAKIIKHQDIVNGMNN